MLTEYGIYASENDMHMLMKRFDKDKNGLISYAEFIEEMTPRLPEKKE